MEIVTHHSHGTRGPLAKADGEPKHRGLQDTNRPRRELCLFWASKGALVQETGRPATGPRPLLQSNQATTAAGPVPLLTSSSSTASGPVPMLTPQVTPAAGPAPLLLCRAGNISQEWATHAAGFQPTEWEAEMQQIGHASQPAFTANFTADFEDAINDPGILENIPRNVRPSPYNRAPHGMAGS